MNSKRLAKLRQTLRQRLEELDEILEPAFEREPVFPGKVLLSRHRCGRDSCRCATEGLLHESLRLQIRFADQLATRCLSSQEAEDWKPRTEAYKRMRDARSDFGKWQKEILQLLDAVETARRSSSGLSAEDRQRALR